MHNSKTQKVEGRNELNNNKYTQFTNKLGKSLEKLNNTFSHIIFLCIGTEKIIGDSVGPIIGSNIKNLENEYIKVYGICGKNLDFSNAKNIIEKVYKKYSNPFIITIDAALSKEKRVGEIHIGKGFMKIGTALEKSITFYSNINIKCVVGKYNSLNQKENINILNNVVKERVYSLAEIVSQGIKIILKNTNIYV